MAAQVASAWAALDAASRDASLYEALTAQDRAFAGALREMQVIRDFVGTPEAILGNPSTKHGEIAEQVHVGVRRALDVLHGKTPSATFEGIGRIDAVDYQVGSVDVQSKYINGLRNTLDHVLEHAEKYPEFVERGGVYHVASDQAEQIAQLHQMGNIDGLSERSVRTIQEKLGVLREASGRSTEDLVQPGEASYAEVQQGQIHKTVENREGKLEQRNGELKNEMRADHGPSIQGLGQAAALGAAAGGGVRLGQALWVKCREGKNPFKGDFSAEDWRDVGVQTVKGAGGGAIAGGALYVVTNSTDLAAPFAGALVSGLMGVGELVRQHQAGEIDGDQFVEMSHIVAADAAIVGLASAAGQALIPVPVVGALVGSLAGKFVASSLKQTLGDQETELLAKLDAYQALAYQRLDAECQALLARLDDLFTHLKRLAEVAFDEAVNTNLRLSASIHFAELVGVDEQLIIRTTGDLDEFMSA